MCKGDRDAPLGVDRMYRRVMKRAGQAGRLLFSGLRIGRGAKHEGGQGCKGRWPRWAWLQGVLLAACPAACGEGSCSGQLRWCAQTLTPHTHLGTGLERMFQVQDFLKKRNLMPAPAKMAPSPCRGRAGQCAGGSPSMPAALLPPVPRAARHPPRLTGFQEQKSAWHCMYLHARGCVG